MMLERIRPINVDSVVAQRFPRGIDDATGVNVEDSDNNLKAVYKCRMKFKSGSANVDGI